MHPIRRRVVLTGAPGAGKSTLLEAAAKEGMATSPEVARKLLKAPGGMELRANDPLGFAEAMLEAHYREFEQYQDYDGPVIFDRGFPDVAAFYELTGRSVPAAVDKACRSWRYAGPILRAPAWREIYHQDAERIQTWEEAVASDEAVTAAWRRYGYEPIELPLTTVKDRLRFLRGLI
ncbi:MAG: AAA family ATPase [Novosphingobium sp.]